MQNMTIRVLEDIFVTEGTPEETFIKPPNFNEILVDIRHPGKPVIIEGPSGTGKTCAVKKILESLGKTHEWRYLSGRKSEDINFISELLTTPSFGVFIIDDFHRLHPDFQNKLSNIAKIAAEEPNLAKYPKLILIGINQVGSALIHFSPDIAKRCGIHKVYPASKEQTLYLIDKGSKALNIEIKNLELIHQESKGDYWLTQTLCKTACTIAGITETQRIVKEIIVDLSLIRRSIVDRLESAYYEPVKEFCRGRRFRPSNDPYFRILNCIALNSDDSSIDLIELANSNPNISGSVNNIKDSRLSTLLSEKVKAGQYFYFNKESFRFSIEDPAVFYFIKNLDWEKLRRDCGFRTVSGNVTSQFDASISFAGENREIARQIARRLQDLDVSIFIDEDYESKYLGKSLSKTFEQIFSTGSRFVICLLDKFHKEKIWPTFEREVFVKRVERGEVIPIYLDNTIFPGIPDDLFCIKIAVDTENDQWRQVLDDKVILKLLDRIA